MPFRPPQISHEVIGTELWPQGGKSVPKRPRSYSATN
jgi:hypothetical protein